MVRTDGFPSAGMVVTDSVTLLDGRAAGAVVVAGSHSGVYPARLVAVLGARAVAFNDAGVGKDRAGIAGLEYLDGLGLPAVAVGHETARIGDGHDGLERGVVRHVNRVARELGCSPGMTCRTAVWHLSQAPPRRWPAALRPEGRHRLLGGVPEVWALDSVSLAGAEDAGRTLVTGSHGGLLCGRAATALNVDAAVVLFNDAGVGIDGAGLTRLPVLDGRGIPAATVAAGSARIGDGRSTYADGIVSAVNQTAGALGARPGMPARTLVDRLVAAARGHGG
jgi:hypothetical protein